MKRLIYLLVAGLAALGGQHAAAQSTGTFDYSSYAKLGNFEWTDGNGVKHTSTYTDVATDPSHIMELLGNAYTNTKVPGIWQGGYTANDEREGDAYYGKIGGWNINTVTKPETEGYTTFLVQVKDDWTSQSWDDDVKVSTRALTKEYINKAIKSVTLLYDRVIVGGSNPGVLYKLPNGELSRFYMISKGRARHRTDTAQTVRQRTPFKAMFEEYSPVAASESSGLTDFYTKLLAGEVYSVVHDCLSVTSAGHYFCMTGTNSSETRQVSNLMFFLPDKRLKYWAGRIDKSDANDEFQCYNPDYAPKMGMYAVKLKASAAPSTTSGNYTVTLNWTSTLSEMLGKGVVKEAFHLYKVESDPVKGETLTEIPLTDSTATTYSYDVPIETAGRVITYRVSGHPFDQVTFLSKTWSNDDNVEIPGTDAHVRLAITGKTRSEYLPNLECNQYRNTITMDNAIGNKINAGQVAVGAKFYIYRVGGTKTADCAIVEITAKDDTYFNYSVKYNSQDGAIESMYPAKTGTFGVNSDGTINFRGFRICDQFRDKTNKNEQAALFSYQAQYIQTGVDYYYSNHITLKVYKTSSAMTNSVTEAAAKADKDHSLTFTEVPQIQFSVEKGLNIKQYTVIRDPATATATTIGRAQGNNQDSLSVFELYNTGMKWVRNSESPVTVNDNTYGFSEYARYVPVISVNADNDTVNTYGCDIKLGYAAKVTASVEGKTVSEYELEENGKKIGAHYFKTTLNVEASVPKNALDIVAYRMWRDCGDKAVEEKDEYASRKDPLTPWFDGFESTAQEKKNFYELLNGAAQSGELTISDMFGAKTPTAGDPLEVKYTVRLYCVDYDGNYYVAESTVPVTFDTSTPTGLNGVISDNGNGFSVAPSIARGQITVSGCDGAVVVRSITGAVVMSLAGNGQSVRTLSIDGLAPGCYIVTSGSHSQRIIKN